MWETVITVMGKDFRLFQQYDEAVTFFAELRLYNRESKKREEVGQRARGRATDYCLVAQEQAGRMYVVPGGR